MKPAAVFLFAGLAWALVAVGEVGADDVVYLGKRSEWKFFPGLEEPATPDTPLAWTTPGFDDSGWLAGEAPFGYGDDVQYGTDLSGFDPPMRRNYSTFYVRGTFDAADPSKISQLAARLNYDDGVVLWINGRELLRLNAPGNPGDSLPRDASSDGSHEGVEPEEFFLEGFADALVAGENLVAAHILNSSANGADTMFELELVDPFGPDLVPPETTVVGPFPGSTVRRLNRVEITFSEPVTGVDAEDLLVNGNPALVVLGEEAGPYTFSFDQPPQGDVVVAFATGHGITDKAETPNAFAGGTWNFTLDVDAPFADLVISEILAANGRGLQDEDGEESEWIEIENRGPAVRLFGYTITDDPDAPGMWVLPDVTLGTDERLVVFASGKDRRPGDSELHTNFKLAPGGEYLGLFSPEVPRVPIAELTPEYPEQRPDFSWGLNDFDQFVYFETPTPGGPNTGGQEFVGFTVRPKFSVDHGFFDAPFDLEIFAVTPESKVYYTLDGSEPDPTSTLYEGPIEIAGTPARGVVTLRAAAFKDGLLPSRIVTKSYIFPEHVLTQPARPSGFPTAWGSQPADYEMNPQIIDPDRDMAIDGLLTVPALSIVTEIDHLFDRATGIYANPSRSGLQFERPTSAELIYPDGREGFQIDCGIRTQGGSSTNGWKARKVSMRLLFKQDYGEPALRFDLYPGYPVRRFDTLLMDAGMNLTLNHPDHGQRIESQYVRDQYMADLQNEMGGHGPRGVFVNVFLDGIYWGIYYVHERPDASYAAENFGGEKEEYDALRHTASTIVDGGNRARTSFNTLLTRARGNFQDPANYEALKEHLDLEDFADYMLVNHWGGNTDWSHHNWYTTRKDPDGVFLFHSWDAEHVLKNVGENRLSRNDSGTPTEIFQRLRASDEFRLLYADRVHRHFFNGGPLYVDPENPAWDPANPKRNRAAEIYMRRINEINSAILLEYARWGDNYRAQTYTRTDWLRELSDLQRTYFPNRTRNVLAHLKQARIYPNVEAPQFNQHGGVIEPGFQLEVSAAEGTIHVTLDGTDPRVPVTGEVSDDAITYTGPLTLVRYTRVKARVFDGTDWSALNEAVFRIDSRFEDLRITEILYNPLGGPTFEFIELHNSGSAVLDLTGAQFTDGITHVFGENVTIEPDGYLVLVSNPTAFASRFPGVPIGGTYAGKLDNAGEKVTLRDSDGEEILSLGYDDEDFWPIGADGFGYSLVLVDDAIDPNDPSAWRASSSVDGTPGAPNEATTLDGVVINEVMSLTESPREGAIELRNLTSSDVSIGGWFLSDSRADDVSLRKFEIPENTTIPGGGFAVFYENQFTSSIALDPAGGTIYLSGTLADGDPTGYITAFKYRAAGSDVSTGRISTSAGPDLAALDRLTFGVDNPATVESFREGTGAPNAAPRIGSIVINEIQYHPTSDGDLEFVELHNRTDAPLSLLEWQIDGISTGTGPGNYEFADVSIPARGYVLIVGTEPQAFRKIFDVPAEVPIVGPFAGSLDNGGERLNLLRPGPEVGGEVLHELVDFVRYNDTTPWPLEADGGGRSLERIRSHEHGNDPANWAASAPENGTPGAENSVNEPGGIRGQIPGDHTQDGIADMTDAVALLVHLFLGEQNLPCDGDVFSAGNRGMLDANGDQAVDSSDAIHVLFYQFRGGPAHVLGIECTAIEGCAERCER